MPSVRVSPRMHVAEGETGCLVLLDERSGTWHALNPTGALCWQELARTGDLEAAAAAVSSRYPGGSCRAGPY